MGKGAASFWSTILQIALAIMLIIGGCNVFFGRFLYSDELISNVSPLFNGTLKDVVIYTLAVIEIIAGVLLILDLFKVKSLDKLDDICILIIMILWLVVFIVLGDIIPLIKGNLRFVNFLAKISKDLVILCSFGIIKAKI